MTILQPNVVALPSPSAATAHAEARRALLGEAHRKTGAVPPDLLVDHVLATTTGAPWPVQLGAFEAVLRRLAFAKRDGLEVGAAPARR